MLVLIDDRQKIIDIDDNLQELIRNAAAAVIEFEECEENFEISVSFVDDKEMQSLNNQYRGIDSSTDVLSFPIMDFEESEPIGSLEDFIDEDLVLGDIVISTMRAAEQAEEYGHSIERELTFLMVHGMLHLLGENHDEKESEEVMFKKQEEILEKLGIGRENTGCGTMNYEKLIAEALLAKDKSYSPYSNFRVGAALLASSGEIYRGCNVENASFGATICAERTAMVKAVSEGERSFKAIAIVSDSPEYTAPCGICRQFLSEFGIDMKVIMSGKENIKVMELSKLLPEAFLPKSLK